MADVALRDVVKRFDLKLLKQDASYVYLLQSGCCQSSLLKVLK